MQFTLKSKRVEPPLTDKDVGKRRVRRKFLFWPRRFGNLVRWLCPTSIVEEVTAYADYVGAYRVNDVYKWDEIGFFDQMGVQVAAEDLLALENEMAQDDLPEACEATITRWERHERDAHQVATTNA